MLQRDFEMAVAAQTRLTIVQVQDCMSAMRDVCAREIVATGKTRIPQLVEIKITEVSERIVRNPKTGQEWLEGPSHRVFAKASPRFARRVRGEKKET